MKSHSIEDLLQRTPDFETEDREGCFWIPEKFNDGSLWVGRFKGRSPWERHSTTDELLHVLKGNLEVTILPDEGEAETVAIPAGSVFVVPKGSWHRVHASDWVTSCGVTPGQTDHSEAEDPRRS